MNFLKHFKSTSIHIARTHGCEWMRVDFGRIICRILSTNYYQSNSFVAILWYRNAYTIFHCIFGSLFKAGHLLTKEFCWALPAGHHIHSNALIKCIFCSKCERTEEVTSGVTFLCTNSCNAKHLSILYYLKRKVICTAYKLWARTKWGSTGD